MSDSSVKQLEREVEAVRAKLAGDLSVLRAPETLQSFTGALKAEALSTKDAMVESAKSSARSSVQALIDDLKGRAAANPTALLAIAAGIGWRLYQKPPIATALVGAGLYSLWQTAPMSPIRDRDYLSLGTRRLKEQAADAAHVAHEQARQLAAGVKTQAAEVTNVAMERAGELAATVKNQATGIAAAATDKVQELGSETRAAVRRATPEMVRSLTGNGQSASNDQRRAVVPASFPYRNPLEATNVRDQWLLGAAAVAVGAALGIAYLDRRRPKAEATPPSPSRVQANYKTRSPVARSDSTPGIDPEGWHSGP